VDVAARHKKSIGESDAWLAAVGARADAFDVFVIMA
jgi:hypothetical protein